MSVCLFLNSYFKTMAAGHFALRDFISLEPGRKPDFVLVYVDAVFQEKLTAKCITGIALSFAGLLIINLL